MASDFDTLTTARNSKWENSAPGNVLTLSSKVSSKGVVPGKVEMFTQKESNTNEKSTKEGPSKLNKTIGDSRDKTIPNTSNSVPEFPPNAMLSMLSGMSYSGLGIAPNYADTSAITTAAAYALGMPPVQFPLPVPFNPNIAVASVMPNAIETLAAQLAVGQSPQAQSPHTACTSPSDLTAISALHSLRSRIPFASDYEQMEYLARLYSPPFLNPFRAQETQTFSKLPSTRKPQTSATKSDKSRKDISAETNFRRKGVSTYEQNKNYFQNGDDVMNNNHIYKHSTKSAETKVKQKNERQHSSPKMVSNKVKTFAIKEQKKPNEMPLSTENNEVSRVKGSNATKNKINSDQTSARSTVKPPSKPLKKQGDFGAEEAAAILLHLSNAADNESITKHKESTQNLNTVVKTQQPIDYSSRSAAHKNHPAVIDRSLPKSNSNLTKHVEDICDNKCDESININANLVTKSMQTNTKPDYMRQRSSTNLSDGEAGYETQPGGFNFKKVICKKFTAERDPNDPIKELEEDNQHVENGLQNVYKTPGCEKLKDKSVNIFDNTQPGSNFSSVMYNSKNSKTSKPAKPKTNVQAKISVRRNSKQFKHDVKHQKPHHGAQSFSDLRAISKQFQTSNNNNHSKISNRSSAKGLYRDAFGGSSDSLESLGEESDNENKQESSETETEESSSDESDKDSEAEYESEKDAEKSPVPGGNSGNSSTKRPFALSRPKFTLSKPTFLSNDQTPKDDENKADQRITIRSPTFKFSRTTAPNETCESSSQKQRSAGSDSHKQKARVMPRASAITLPKPRIAARVSNDITKYNEVDNLPELKLEESSKSSLINRFMHALNKSGETGGKPVGIPVDHKSLKAIGLANTSYILHNNKKYILRRALARKKSPVSKQEHSNNGEDVVHALANKSKRKYVIQEIPSIKTTKKNKKLKMDNNHSKDSCTVDNDLNQTTAEQVNQNNANSDQRISKEGDAKTQPKRRKKPASFIPIMEYTDDSDIFSKVKLRHRTSVHNQTKDNVNSNSSQITNLTSNTTHHSRKRRLPRHSKRTLKNTGDSFLLSHFSNYKKSVARAKRIRQQQNIRKQLIESVEEKRPAQCVRIMAGASRPSYLIIQEAKDKNNFSQNLDKKDTNGSINNNNGYSGTFKDSQLPCDAIANLKENAGLEINCKNLQEKLITKNNFDQNKSDEMPSTLHKSNENEEWFLNLDPANKHKNSSMEDYKDDIENNDYVPIIAGASSSDQKTTSNDENLRIKNKRKANMSRPNVPSKSNFKLLSLFPNPPSLCIGRGVGDLETSLSLCAYRPIQDTKKYKSMSNVYKNWKQGESALEIKHQQQRDGWKNMTLNTFTLG